MSAGMKVEFIRDGHVTKEVRINGVEIPLLARADININPGVPNEIHLVLLADEIVFTQRRAMAGAP
jgi:hypothetical protein